MGSSVFAKIRRNSNARICFLEICGLVYVFIAGAFGSKLELLTGVPDVPRLAIPVAAVMLVFLLRNAYRPSREHDYAIAMTDIALAMAAAILSQVLLSFLKPDWAMPRWAPTQGGFVGTMFVTVVRSLFPQGPQDRPGSRISNHSLAQDEIQWMAAEFRNHVRRRNISAVIVSLIVSAASSWVFAHTGMLRIRIACSGIVLFALAIVLRLVTMEAAQARFVGGSPAHYGAELKRQRRFLQWVFCGYVAVLLPATVLFLAGSHVYEFVVIVYMLLFAELILRKAETCQEGLRQVEGFESERALPGK